MKKSRLLKLTPLIWSVFRPKQRENGIFLICTYVNLAEGQPCNMVPGGPVRSLSEAHAPFGTMGGAPPPPQKWGKLILHTFGGGGPPPPSKVCKTPSKGRWSYWSSVGQLGAVGIRPKLLQLCRTTLKLPLGASVCTSCLALGFRIGTS